MSGETDLDHTQQQSSPGNVDRRRPGRQETVAPALLPLLRNEASHPPFHSQSGAPYPDQLSAMRGIALSVALSCLVAVSCTGLYLLAHH